MSTTKKQRAVKKLKGPIVIPVFTTNPYQHTRAHLLAWLPLSNKKKEKAIKTKRRKQKKEITEKGRIDRNWHPIGNVEGVRARHLEGLRKQLKEWETEAEEIRQEEDTPTILYIYIWLDAA
jgi:hypothetical protein